MPYSHLPEAVNKLIHSPCIPYFKNDNAIFDWNEIHKKNMKQAGNWWQLEWKKKIGTAGDNSHMFSCIDNSTCNHITFHYSTKDVHQNGFHLVIWSQNLKCLNNLLHINKRLRETERSIFSRTLSHFHLL